MKRQTAAILVIFLTSALSIGGWHLYRNRPEAAQKFSCQIFDTFDTLVTFTAFAENEAEFDRYRQIVQGEMSRLHRLFDIYHDYENLINVKSLNDAAGTTALPVAPAVVELLEYAKEAYEETGGAVNVALGPVLEIWHDHRGRALSGDVSVPSPEDLRAAATYISPHDIIIDHDRSTVLLRHQGMRLDVGAIGKGYAVQKTIERLQEAGLKSGLINAGGNVVVTGPPLDGRDAWNIGIHAPVDDMNTLTDVLSLSAGSVVTSGNDQRYYTAAGKRYHHIIDPQTLYPTERVKSVSILHPDSAIADILSTAAFIMPQAEAEKLIARKEAEAFWVLPDDSEIITAGYYRFSKHRQAPEPKTEMEVAAAAGIVNVLPDGGNDRE